MKYLVKKIQEADFGCEEWQDGHQRMVLLLLCDEAGCEIDWEAADEYLYSQGINEGDWVSLDKNHKIVKEQ